MEIKVYADHNAQVITEEEFLDQVRVLTKSYDEDMDMFEEFLCNRYGSFKIWSMTEDEKANVKELFHEENVKAATDVISSDWLETVLEI